MTEDKIYRIGEFAKMIGIKVNTLQKWDRANILKAKRTPTNLRFYTHDQYLDYIKKGNRPNMFVVIAITHDGIDEIFGYTSSEKIAKIRVEELYKNKLNEHHDYEYRPIKEL